MTPVRLEPGAPQSRVKHSTTEPLRSTSTVNDIVNKILLETLLNQKIAVFVLLSVTGLNKND